MAVIGKALPYGSDTGWMKSGTSQTMTVGAAASVSGTYGSWSANGTSSATSGVTFTWAESVAYRDFRVQLKYGKFRLRCGGIYFNDYTEMVRYPTGGFTTASLGSSTYANCVPVSQGLWARSSGSGNHFSTSVGVKIASLLGIDLSLDANYSTTHTLYYRLVANGKVCGDNDQPSPASNSRSWR